MQNSSIKISSLVGGKHLALNFIKLFVLWWSVHFSLASPRKAHLKQLESDEKTTFLRPRRG